MNASSGSPIHVGPRTLDGHQKANQHYRSQSQTHARGGVVGISGCGSYVECPADIMMKIVVPALDQMLLDRRIGIDEANCIIVTMRVPIDMAQSLGLLLSPSPPTFDAYQQQQQQQHPQQPAFLNQQPQSHQHAHHPQYQHSHSQNIPTTAAAAPSGPLASASTAASPSSGGGSLSGAASPAASYYGGGASPMHQITKGISGLTTGGGSITRGTSHVADIALEQPLDLSMDVSSSSAPPVPVCSMFYDLSTQRGVAIPVPATTASAAMAAASASAGAPNLCIIQEEMLQQQQHRISVDELAASAVESMQSESGVSVNCAWKCMNA